MNDTMYQYYSELIMNCTGTVIYNIDSKGYGNDKLIDGNTKIMIDDGKYLTYSLLEK